ncbi:thiol reductant ABC exporter subunit CydD [Paenalcaligenes sp. Me131]|uniref:thiol reductant ABC exporter subunit CydD n=1 Tax=Paenalcaligenes sp. Me131 TaxID=3392636 RepID=UPI003D2B3121
MTKPLVVSSPRAKRSGGWLAQSWRLAPRRMLWALCAPLLAGVLFLFQAWWLADILDRAVIGHAALQQLWPAISIVAGLLLVRALLVWSGERAANSGAEHIKHWLRATLMQRLLDKGPAWSRQHPSGELTTALIDHVEALEGYLQRYMSAAVAAVFLPLLLAVVAMGVDIVVGLLLLLTAPLIPVFMALVGWGAEAANQKYHQALQRLSGVFGDRVKGVFTLVLFGRAKEEVEAVQQASQDLGKTTMKVLRIAFLSSAVLELFAALGVAGVAVYIGLSYLGMLGESFSGMTLQQGLFCLFLAPEVYQPLRQMAASYHDRAQAKSAITSLEGIFKTLPAVPSKHVDHTCTEAVPEKWEGVSVRFPMTDALGDTPILQTESFSLTAPGTDTVLLKPVSFTVNKGESVALQGSSGSGKTTLLESLLGLRTRHGGEVRLYTADKQTDDEHAFLPGVCLLTAHPFLSGETVEQVLKLAAPEATDEQLWQALDKVEMAQVLRTQHAGLQTLLGTRGYGLSGGQLQRIALARLFLCDPELVLMDEPTAHLDTHTRDRVLDAILAFCADRALIIATHDPAVAARLQQQWSLQDQTLVGVQS